MIITKENITDLIGCKFITKSTSSIFKIGKVEHKKCGIIDIRQIEVLELCSNTTYIMPIYSICRNLNNGTFILDKSFLRKKKLKKLMNEFKGKI